MRAIIAESPGGPDVLRIGRLPDPVPGPGDLLVRVHATALNRLDLMQRAGRYPLPAGAPETLGVEMAGEVNALGDGLSGWAIGDRVCALLLGGGYAELVVVPADMAMRLPDTLSYEQGAAIPEVFITAYLNLIVLGGLGAGDTALIHAGASGVGTAAIQLTREIGARSLVTVGSRHKASRCLELGASGAFNYHDGPFQQAVLEATGGWGVQVILDMVGAPYWEQNVACAASAGRIILLATQGGSRLQIDLGALQAKRLHVIGSVLRPLPLPEKAALTAAFAAFALPRFADGRLVPVIDRVFDWSEAAEAHRYMETNTNIGKIVLAIR